MKPGNRANSVGRLDSYYHAPTGTSVGHTDSLPLIAFALKPFERWLAMPMQYLGLWMLLCFAFQGAFGVLAERLVDIDAGSGDGRRWAGV